MSDDALHCPDGQVEIPTDQGFVCLGAPRPTDDAVTLARRGSNLPPVCSDGQILNHGEMTGQYTCIDDPNAPPHVNWGAWVGPGVLFILVFVLAILLLARKKDKD
jgi:hypothetical protein